MCNCNIVAVEMLIFVQNIYRHLENNKLMSRAHYWLHRQKSNGWPLGGAVGAGSAGGPFFLKELKNIYWFECCWALWGVISGEGGGCSGHICGNIDGSAAEDGRKMIRRGQVGDSAKREINLWVIINEISEWYAHICTDSMGKNWLLYCSTNLESSVMD